MAEALELLWLPFLASVLLVGVHAYFGIHVLARNVIFVDLALAQIAALGATAAFMAGYPPQGAAAYAYSLLAALLGAGLLTLTRLWAGRLPQEALIGVIYVVAAAAAFLLVDKAPQGAEHIKQILTGNILLTSAQDLYTVAPLYAAITGLHALAARRGLFSGSAGRLLAADLAFYGAFALVVTSSVALAGVLLVFSFLIIPAAVGTLYAERFSARLVIGWLAGTAASAAGLAAAFAWDLSTGAAMVCAFGLALATAGALRPWLRSGASREHARRALHWLRRGAAGVAVLSGLWWLAAPKADQPAVDALEHWIPAARSLYMNERELGIVTEAASFAERYRREAGRLNEMESRSRWTGRALEDEEVRKISSYIQSYNEMRKGEEFVQREVRARARERTRWPAGIALTAIGALLSAPLWLPRPPWRSPARSAAGDSA